MGSAELKDIYWSALLRSEPLTPQLGISFSLLLIL